MALSCVIKILVLMVNSILSHIFYLLIKKICGGTENAHPMNLFLQTTVRFMFKEAYLLDFIKKNVHRRKRDLPLLENLFLKKHDFSSVGI